MTATEILDRDFITALYESILHRKPDADGLATYLRGLASGRITKAQVVDLLLGCDEFKTLQSHSHQRAVDNARTPIVQVEQFNKQLAPYEIFDLTGSAVLADGDPYMTSMNCIGSDFFHPRFREFCAQIYKPPALHRKTWEFAFIYHHLTKAGAIRPGARGLGFGVGVEPLPSLFASLGCEIEATDAPPEISDSGWEKTNQHSNSKDDLFYPEILDRATFDSSVSFSYADMNNIPAALTGFDFCWSSCCFEHLGSIENGLNFVEQSVERTLAAGGVACHTSELNLSSDDETIDSGNTVLFRVRDVERLADRLEARGHHCERLPIKAPASFVDHLVDLPPYSDFHLKLRLGAFVTTSFGLVVTRGAT